MTLMRCPGVNAQGYGGFSGHPGIARFERQVPFEEAITAPPECELHRRPYLTPGGYALNQVLQRFAETGVITDQCKISRGSEQAAWCHPHGWGGRSSDAYDHCPNQRLAAWIVRRHEYGAELERSGGAH